MAAVERARSRSPPMQPGHHVPLYRDRLQPRGVPRGRPLPPPSRGGGMRNPPASQRNPPASVRNPSVPVRGGGMARAQGGFRERRPRPVQREMLDYRDTKPRQTFADNVDGYQGYDGYSEPGNELRNDPYSTRNDRYVRQLQEEYPDQEFQEYQGYPEQEPYQEDYSRQSFDYDRAPDYGPARVDQGGFRSRGKFDMSYPEERGEMRPQREERVARAGDWTCTECLFSNFASRVACYKCQKAKSVDAPETLSLKNWECTECYASNHERRFDCFKCQKPKPKNAKECAALEDWTCPGCRCNNNARRTNCARCDAARPGREKELEQNPDWKCGACGIMNWSWRQSCYKCQAGKEDGKVPEGAPQDWDCGECGKSNWARRVQCYSCKSRK